MKKLERSCLTEYHWYAAFRSASPGKTAGSEAPGRSAQARPIATIRARRRESLQLLRPYSRSAQSSSAAP